MLSDCVLLSILISLIGVCHATATAASSLMSVSKPSINLSPRSLTIQNPDVNPLELPETLNPSSSTPFTTDQNHRISLVARSYTGDNPSGYSYPTVFFDTETYFYYSSLGVRSSTLAAYTTDTFLFESDSRYDFTGQSYPTTAVFCFSIDANCVTLVDESGTTTRAVVLVTTTDKVVKGTTTIAVVPVTKTSLSVWTSAVSLMTASPMTVPKPVSLTSPGRSFMVDTSDLLSSVTAGVIANILLTSTQRLPTTAATETLIPKSTLLTTNTPLPQTSLSPSINTSTTISPHAPTTNFGETTSTITSIVTATSPISSINNATSTVPMSTALQSSAQQTAGGFSKYKSVKDRRWTWGTLTVVLMGVAAHLWL